MRNYIKILLSALLLCFGMGARADNIVSIGSASGTPNEEVTLSISLQNASQVAALQLSVPLDEELSYVDGSASLTERCSASHNVTAGVKNGVLNVMVYSLDMTAISGTEGEVATLRLKLGNQPKTIALSASKLLLTDTGGNTINDATATNGSVSIRCAKAEYGSMAVDFGRVPIRSTYQKTLTVRNVGNEPLVVTGLEFQNYVTKFSSTTQFPLTIAAGSSSSINITYAPEERGTVNETVKVLCNSISKLNTITLMAQPFAVNELHVQPASGTADETVTVSLSMNNMDAISGFQFEFTLPSQLEFVPNSFVLSDRKANHAVVQSVTNGVLRIICYSPSDTPFTGEDGELATMQFRLSGRNSTTLAPSKCVLTATIDNQVTNVCSANYGGNITILSPRLSANSSLNMGRTPITSDAISNFTVRNYGNAPLTISRVTFDKEEFYIQEEMPLAINAGGNTTLHVVYPSQTEGDYATTMQLYTNDPEQRLWNVNVTGNRFAPNYFEISTGDVSAFDNLSIDVAVNTYDPIVGIQFDLTYPSQVYEPFDNNYTLEPRAESMIATWRQIDNNTLRYFCYFLSGDGIAAGEGKVMSILLAPKGGEAPGGHYTVGVKNIKLGTSEMADKYAGQNSESSFTVYVPVQSISISESSMSLEVGKTTTLTASVNENATNQGLVWSSADESIATISNDGIVTGRQVGTTVITVASEENPDIYAICELTVLIFPVESISISDTSLALEGGESVQLTASVNENATNQNIVWSSSDRNIAIVSENGKVVGRHQGTAIITVASEENPDIYATCEVTVTSDIAGGMILPDAPFEFFYNATEYDEESHSIPNHPLANLSEYSLQLAENIPEKREECMLHIEQRCRGYIDRWADESTESGRYFYRTGNNCMTIVCKVSPNYGSGNNASDFISNRGSGYNYMFRIGDHGRMFLHTGTAYSASRSMAINANEPQILAVRVDGNNNNILLQNLTTGESLRVNGVNWGGGNNIFKFFYNDPNEYFRGDFYWVYYSFELLTDDQIKYFADYLPGDVNRDKQISIADVTALVNIILGKDNTMPYLYDHDAANVNGDNTISIADVTALVNIILGKTN